MSQRPLVFIGDVLNAIAYGSDFDQASKLIPVRLLDLWKEELLKSTTSLYWRKEDLLGNIRHYETFAEILKRAQVGQLDNRVVAHYTSDEQKAACLAAGMEYKEYFVSELVKLTGWDAAKVTQLDNLANIARDGLPRVEPPSQIRAGPTIDISKKILSQFPSACQQFLMPCLNVVFYLIQAVLARYTVNSFELACGLGAVATVFSGVMVYRHGNCLVRACLTSLAPVLIENLLEAYLGQHLPEPVNVGITFVVQCLVHFFADVSKRNLLRALALLGGLIGPITQASMVGVSYGTNPVNHTYKISLDPSKVRSTVVFSSGDTATYVPLVGEGCIMDVNTNQISIPDSEVFQQGPTWATCDYTKFRVYVETKSVDDKEVSRSGVFEEEMQVVSHEAIVKAFSEVASILESYGLGDVVMKIRDALPSFVRKSMGVGF